MTVGAARMAVVAQCWLEFLGVVPVLAAWAVWLGLPWSWMASLIVGGALVVWITVQILVIGYQVRPPLQAFYGTLGLLLIGLSMIGSVRRYAEGRGSVER